MFSTSKGKQILCVEAKEVCPLCFMDNHSLMQCPWMYSKCPQEGCSRIRMVIESQPEKLRYLQCQDPNCPEEPHMLDDAMKIKKQEEEQITALCKNFKLKAKLKKELLHCLHCGYGDHEYQHCPQRISSCSKPGCRTFMHLRTSSEKDTYGRHFWECPRCFLVEWAD